MEAPRAASTTAAANATTVGTCRVAGRALPGGNGDQRGNCRRSAVANQPVAALAQGDLLEQE